MKRQIKFHGLLAEKYTAEPFHLNVDDTPTLLSLLDANFPGMKYDFVKERVALVLKDGDEIKAIDNIYSGEYGSEPEIHLAAGMPFAYEAAAAWVVEYFAVSQATAYAIVNAAIAFVANVAIAYISAAMADKPQEEASKDERKSWLFDGAYNQEGMGHPVPLCYGRFRTGSMVISSAIDTVKNAIAISDHWQLINDAPAITGNVLENDVSPTALTVIDFTYQGSTYAAGTPISVGGVNITINADGSYTASSSGVSADTHYCTYRITNGVTESTATIKIDITFNVQDYNVSSGP